MGGGARCGMHVRRLDALFDWESVSWHLPGYHPPPSTYTHTVLGLQHAAQVLTASLLSVLGA